MRCSSRTPTMTTSTSVRWNASGARSPWSSAQPRALAPEPHIGDRSRRGRRDDLRRGDGARDPRRARGPSASRADRGSPPGLRDQRLTADLLAGDTDLFPDMDGLVPDLDLALSPIWGWGPTLGGGGHLDPLRAAEALRLLRPRIAVPIHWGTYRPLHRSAGAAFLADPAEAFAREAATKAPEVEIRVCGPVSTRPSGTGPCVGIWNLVQPGKPRRKADDEQDGAREEGAAFDPRCSAARRRADRPRWRSWTARG